MVYIHILIYYFEVVLYNSLYLIIYYFLCILLFNNYSYYISYTIKSAAIFFCIPFKCFIT